MENPYREQILDHYHHPRNYGVLEDADASGELDNPLCGDVVRFDLRLHDGRVSEARFSGRGCVISIAAASILSEAVRGKSVEALQSLQDADMFEMLGVTLGPARAQCALLPLRALRAGLRQREV